MTVIFGSILTSFLGVIAFAVVITFLSVAWMIMDHLDSHDVRTDVDGEHIVEQDSLIYSPLGRL
jgi:hypothetical protein